MHPETGKLWKITREYVTHAAIGGAILLHQKIAAGIPGARLVALPGDNHIPQERDPAYDQMFDEIDRFMRN